MEAFVGPIVDRGLCLWDTMADLKENLDSLEVAMERLKQVFEDVKTRVKIEEKLSRKHERTNEVAGWLDRVRRMEAEVIVILKEGKEQEQEKCLGGRLPKNVLSSYNVGKRVSKKLNEVNELRIEGGFNVVSRVIEGDFNDRNFVDVVCPIWINEKPMEKTVGLELMVEEVWRCIEDSDLQTIGLYGLGGVGKTTLLTQINNEFLNRSSHGFEVVIWLSVSKQPDLKKIKQEILREFQIPDYGSEVSHARYLYSQAEDLYSQAGEIYRTLKGKKFVLLLDDIWERLDLIEMGIPIQHMHQKGSKVVFTTRSLEICGLMEAQRKIKVECLTPEAALDLFRTKVGEDTLINGHGRISKLAKIMAAECKGLPLALVTVGRSMATRKNPEEWEQAISILRNSPSQFQGMNDVLLILKFSFDRLENDVLKSCFLYCCIFPEDYNIRKEELIEFWLGEGFLDEFVDSDGDEFGGLSNVRRKGEYIIGSLKRACLLESGESEEFVTMHQMIRDMALWVCRDKIKMYVKRGAQSTQAYRSGSWNETERISLWDPRIEDLEAINDTQVPNLRTFICKTPMLYTFPVGILLLTPALTVLDLSNSFLLRQLPAKIGKLINLQYLNLSGTFICMLPTELKHLTKLRCLLLDCKQLEIPREMISNFQLLEVFSTRSCNEDLLDELEHLQHISEISIEISTTTSFVRLLRSPKLQQCLKKFYFRYWYGLHSTKVLPSFPIEVSPSLLRRMEHLELNDNRLKEFKISPETRSVQNHYFDNLCQVVIKNCLISNATWLIYAPRLQNLTLSHCTSMEEVIGGTSDSRVAEIEENANLFSSLTTLYLLDLPTLKSICRHALPFPFLTNIKVQKCPSLKKLPFDSNSTKNSLKLISGGRRWWHELQWEDEAIKQVFSSKFVDNQYERSYNED